MFLKTYIFKIDFLFTTNQFLSLNKQFLYLSLNKQFLYGSICIQIHHSGLINLYKIIFELENMFSRKLWDP